MQKPSPVLLLSSLTSVVSCVAPNGPTSSPSNTTLVLFSAASEVRQIHQPNSKHRRLQPVQLQSQVTTQTLDDHICNFPLKCVIIKKKPKQKKLFWKANPGDDVGRSSEHQQLPVLGRPLPDNIACENSSSYSCVTWTKSTICNKSILFDISTLL